MRQITTPVQEKNAGTRQRKPSRWMVATGTTYRTSAVVGRVATGRSIEVGFCGAGGKGVMVEMTCSREAAGLNGPRDRF